MSSTAPGEPRLAALARAFLDRTLEDEDGDTFATELLPPVPPERLAELEGLLGPLPTDVRSLLETCSAIEERFLEPRVVFDAAERDFADVFERCVRLGGDGFGNSWIVDVGSDGSWGPVFFACHDPAAFVVQAPDLATFLQQLLDADYSDEDPIQTVPEQAVMQVWQDRAPGRTIAQALASGDPQLVAFAQQRRDSERIVDLRAATVGTGWSGELLVVARDGSSSRWTARRSRRCRSTSGHGGGGSSADMARPPPL